MTFYDYVDLGFWGHGPSRDVDPKRFNQTAGPGGKMVVRVPTFSLASPWPFRGCTKPS